MVSVGEAGFVLAASRLVDVVVFAFFFERDPFRDSPSEGCPVSRRLLVSGTELKSSIVISFKYIAGRTSDSFQLSGSSMDVVTVLGSSSTSGNLSFMLRYDWGVSLSSTDSRLGNIRNGL